ncbi:MAG: DnaD domain protein [Clostridia bacterium]|nr:DnaD domain protein [Clostridia bacterium]
MTFTFDDQFAMFDITPVENQFVLEYLPAAKGEYVKVYLYGLMCCYHPKKEMDISSMSRELGLEEDEILAAFRYWERRGIVHRVSDHPPAWQYINIKQKSLTSDGDAPNPEYVRFCREVENSFDGTRVFHGSELAACYEWKEDLNFSTEVVLIILKYMARTRGKNFKIRDAEKTAIMLSDEKAFTVEDAEQVLSRDEAITAGFRKVLRKLGMRFNPSDANLKLYCKWIQEWHFSQEAIEDACDRTGTSTPSLALVDAILQQTYLKKGNQAGPLEACDLEDVEKQRADLKQVLKEIGQYGAATPAQQRLYAQMATLYPQNIIMIAARECAAKQSSFESILKLLKSWKERGFDSEEQIRGHIDAFHEKEEYLKKLRMKWAGKDAEIGQKALQLLDKWENTLGFSREMISLAADLSFEARKPASYMDKLLTEWAAQGIRTPEDQEKSRKEQHSGGKEKTNARGVAAQQYTQRDYAGEQEEAMQRMIASMNGGDEDA